MRLEIISKNMVRVTWFINNFINPSCIFAFLKIIDKSCLFSFLAKFYRKEFYISIFQKKLRHFVGYCKCLTQYKKYLTFISNIKCYNRILRHFLQCYNFATIQITSTLLMIMNHFNIHLSCYPSLIYVKKHYKYVLQI